MTHHKPLALILALAVSGVGGFAKFSQPGVPVHPPVPLKAGEEPLSEEPLPTLPRDWDKPLGIIRPCDSAEISSCIQRATRVESFQLDPEIPMTRGSSADRFCGYKIVATGPNLNGSQRSNLKRLLLDPGIAPPETLRQAMTRKLCYLSPHHALRMTGGSGETVDAVICFSCGDLWVVQGEAPSTGGDFSIIEKDLKALCLQIFPDDPHVL